MSRISKIIIGYGVFLIVAGVLGFLSNPEKAKTALMSGGFFGMVSIVVGILARRGLARSFTISLSLVLFLGTVFVWRASVSWMSSAGGQSEKLFAAVLISVMLFASALASVLLVKTRYRQSESTS